jgi:response regulator RpfG family c-di-GMP phosphodiesterase
MGNNQEKITVAVIEDKYRQYQIIERLLNPYFNIVPKVLNSSDYNDIKSKLMEYLNNNGSNVFFETIAPVENVSVFVIDYELKKGSNKTGVLFAQITDIINDGSKPVLFLTKMSDADTTNTITKLPNTNPNIKKDYLRKPENWEDTSSIETIVLNNTSFGNDLKRQIELLIKPARLKDAVAEPNHINKLKHS